MPKPQVRWSLRIIWLAAAALVARKWLVGHSGSGDKLFPPITGDTWAPVPVNLDRHH